MKKQTQFHCFVFVFFFLIPLFFSSQTFLLVMFSRPWATFVAFLLDSLQLTRISLSFSCTHHTNSNRPISFCIQFSVYFCSQPSVLLGFPLLIHSECLCCFGFVFFKISSVRAKPAFCSPLCIPTAGYSQIPSLYLPSLIYLQFVQAELSLNLWDHSESQFHLAKPCHLVQVQTISLMHALNEKTLTWERECTPQLTNAARQEQAVG